MKVDRLVCAIVLLVAGAAVPAAASHNDDVHSDNMRLVGNAPLEGATDVE